jgi:parvulin-like peptidyl-prolyl isomerase
VLAALVALLTSIGCVGDDKPKPTNLHSGAFYREGVAHAERSARAGGAAAAPVEPTARGAPVEPRVPAARTAVRDTPNGPTTAPSIFDKATTAQYMTIGAVVVEVSGTPIYADKVIQALTPLLSSEARQRDQQSFRALARYEIEKQVGAMIQSELWYAAALKQLTAEDKTLARRITEVWRQRQITEAGGSEQLARRKAAADGIEFDERVNEQHRQVLVYLLRQRKIDPRLQVTAQDMRQYYDRNVKTQFSDADQAQFRVIKIDPRKLGEGSEGRARAIDKIKELRDRAVQSTDEEFAKLAASFNHDPSLMRTAGRVGGADGWVQRGSFTVQEVEEAVWGLQPGQVTDVIEAGNAFYLARLENRKLGRVRPFEDEEVQKTIKTALENAQRVGYHNQMLEDLKRDAVIFPDRPLIEPVIEIAMQKYPHWANATATAK